MMKAHMLDQVDEEDEEHDEDEETTQTPSSVEKDTQENRFSHLSSAVTCTKSLVLMVLFLSAVIVSTLTYFLVHGGEIDDFQSQFKQTAEEFVRAATDKADNIHRTITSLTRSFPALATASNSTMPFITIYDFEVFAGSARHLSGATFLAYCPYISTNEMRSQWEDYSVANQGWVLRGHAILDGKPDLYEEFDPIPEQISHRDEERVPYPDQEPPPYWPVWQTSPPIDDTSILNVDISSNELVNEILNFTLHSKSASLSPPIDVQHLFTEEVRVQDEGSPQSVMFHPIFETLNPETSPVVGHIAAVIPWMEFFQDLVFEGSDGIMVVVDSCGTKSSFIIYSSQDQDVVFIGPGDHHDSEYDDMVVTHQFVHLERHENDEGHHHGHHGHGDEDAEIEGDAEAEAEVEAETDLEEEEEKSVHVEHCHHNIYVYPTDAVRESHKTSKPWIYATIVFSVFVFAAAVFKVYDFIVEQRQTDVVGKATKIDDIVSNLFPGKIRDQLVNGEGGGEDGRRGDVAKGNPWSIKRHLMDLVDTGSVSSGGQIKKDCIADLYPEATVIFADICSFTAWSSLRDPASVFTLLESIFQAFDKVAKKRRVFKVETVGDCYVAVAGIPDHIRDHAVVMCRFARDCLDAFHETARGLELALGPDTGELAIRFGIHSGPVTAGVLRGERARFQLFGDTVNTAARVESTGMRDRIHISEQTAALLVAANKGDWMVERQDQVEAKGKGFMKTYWLKTNDDSISVMGHEDKHDVWKLSESLGAGREVKLPSSPRPQKLTRRSQVSKESHTERLVNWNCELLSKLLKQVVARRLSKKAEVIPDGSLGEVARNIGEGHMVVNEVVEVITLPEFDGCSSENPDNIILSKEVVSQLNEYVTLLASMYLNNPFHNFEHAFHVTMSVSKLLSRIVAPKIDVTNDAAKQDQLLHDHTYGITSDPLTQFAVVLSALIHDVDHQGVPNFILAQENKDLAATYNSKSIAEQNSVDLAWKMLMSDNFEDLRSCIFSNQSELRRFRQLLVNSVIATDIFDKDLGALRKARWAKAFSEQRQDDDDPRQGVNRKATIVIEHLIQASDVAHTMQHWHVYRKWNERLFQEMYFAHLSGRMEKDPSQNWYQGEIGFFDNYIIPLAKKLKECGVFGVSSAEYLNYAEQNRREWEVRGEEVVATMTETYKAQFEQEHKNHSSGGGMTA